MVSLLLDLGADIESGYWTTDTMTWGETALSLAQKKKCWSIVRLLFQHGAQDETSQSRSWRDASGRGPLHVAVEGGHLDVVRVLVERGANINKTGKFLTLLLRYSFPLGH